MSLSKVFKLRDTVEYNDLVLLNDYNIKYSDELLKLSAITFRNLLKDKRALD